MIKTRSNLIAALDIGTTKIACFIARVSAEGTLKVIGIGHQVSQGIKGGVITDIKLAENAITAAVHAAEQMAGETIERVVVGISGGSPLSTNTVAELDLADSEVRQKDLKKLLAIGHRNLDLTHRSIIHTIPVSYSLDDVHGMADPVGMSGDLLSADIHFVTVSESFLKNISNCITRCQLEIQDIVASPYAAGLACLTEDDRELGVTLLEMGGGVTGISVFMHGKNVFTDSVPIGGIHVTSDIARGLSTSLTSAERIKTLYGSTDVSPLEAQDIIDIPQDKNGLDQDAEVSIPRSTLVSIIRPRVEEILELARDKLKSSALSRITGRQLVISGGASQLMGMKEMAASILDKNVRAGSAEILEGMADSSLNPSFAVCRGLLKYAVNSGDDSRKNDDLQNFLEDNKNYLQKSRFEQILTWVRRNF